ncbi:MAG: ribonuclease R [Mariprofundaceae bacterium]
MSTKMRRRHPRGEKDKQTARRPGAHAWPSRGPDKGAVIRALRGMPGRSANMHDLERALHLHDGAGKSALRQSVQDLLRQGEISHVGKRLKLADRPELTGEVIAHPDGYGFVRLGKKRDDDAFIPPDQMAGLMHGDRVAIRLVRRRGRQSAEVLRVVETASNTITGQFSVYGGIGIVTPRSRRIPGSISIRSKDANGAHDGDWVRVEIKRGSSPPQGHVIEVLGDILRPSRLIDLVVAEQDLPGPFKQVVLDEALAIPDAIRSTETRQRLDLTHLPFVTIDGEDAKDFDDAICVAPRGDGFELWVAIADVAHYVRPGTHLDIEARIRGNSFYFPDRVIPMLPERLSNGICSLKPNETRLAMAVRMRYDVAGRRRAVHVHEAVICSQARLTYGQVGRWLEHGDEHAIDASPLRDMLRQALTLYRMMDKHRRKRGALEFNLPEVRAVIEKDAVSGLQVREQGVAHHLIEECMLAANTAVVGYLEAKAVALLYRVHESPEPKALETLNDFLAPLGVAIRLHVSRQIHPKQLQQVIQHVKDPAAAHVLHRLILRSMQQACYTPENAGHFGLAYKAYTHFTSPIRRYADITVHRRLKAVLNNTPPDAMQPATELAAIGEETSRQERRQMQAERDSGAMLASLYHSRDVGKTFQAVVSGMTENRLFFELQPSCADASMAVDDLGKRYSFDARMHRLTERASGHTFALGDKLSVCIDSTDPVRGVIRVSLA